MFHRNFVLNDGNNSLVVGALAELNGQFYFFAAKIDGQRDGVTRAFAIQQDVEVKRTGDFLAVNRDDEVATDGDSLHPGAHYAIPSADTCYGGRSTFGRRFYQQAFLRGQIQRFGQLAAHGDSLHAEKRLANTAFGHQVVRDTFGAVDRDSEADARGSAAGREDRGVDTNDFAVRIEERAAGIAAIDGRVRLNSFVDERGLTGLHGAPDGADDAGR